MNKKTLIFALGGVLLDKNYGARRIDADGLQLVLTKGDNYVDIADNLNAYNPKDYDAICIIPKNANLFDNYPNINNYRDSQYNFINKIKELKVNDRPKITMFFNDINIGLHDNYNHEKDIFNGLSFNCVYDFKSDENNKARDIFIDKQYQKHIGQELDTNWILASHINNVFNIEFDDINSDRIKPWPCKEINYEINNLYYGDYRPGVVDSLKKLGMGSNKNDLIIGSQKLADELGTKCIPDKMPMNKVRNYIYAAKYNLLPYEENKTNKQITARVLELVLFNYGRNIAKHIKADNWNIINELENLDDREIINKLLYMFKETTKEINEFI